jgi:hypothetical protein
MDQVSTLQVERAQRWSDLVQLTLTLLLLIDTDRPGEKAGTSWLKITRAQKRTFVGLGLRALSRVQKWNSEGPMLRPGKDCRVVSHAVE